MAHLVASTSIIIHKYDFVTLKSIIHKLDPQNLPSTLDLHEVYILVEYRRVVVCTIYVARIYRKPRRRKGWLDPVQ